MEEGALQRVWGDGAAPGRRGKWAGRPQGRVGNEPVTKGQYLGTRLCGSEGQWRGGGGKRTETQVERFSCYH